MHWKYNSIEMMKEFFNVKVLENWKGFYLKLDKFL